MNRMLRYGKKKTEFWSSTKTGRLPFIRRMFVQRSVDVARRRHLEQVREQRLLAVDVEHDVLDHGPILGRRPSCCQPDFGPVRGGRSR